MGDFFGSNDPCFGLSWPGTCMSQGNFDSFEGNFDGINLNMTGSDVQGGIIEPFYYYIINATKIPSRPIVIGKTPTRDTTPTWHWTSGGGGNGYFRYRLDRGTWRKTRAMSFTAPAALPAGLHTLFVQESDAAGNWSVSGKKHIVINLPTE